MIGGAVLLSAAQCAFNNQLLRTVARTLPDVSPLVIIGTGATELRHAFTPEQVTPVIYAYLEGLRVVFALAAAAFSVATLLGFLPSWKRLHAKQLEGATAAAA